MGNGFKWTRQSNTRLANQTRIPPMNKEICFISRPGDGLSCCCFQSESNPKPRCRAWKRHGKIIVAGVGKQRFDVRRTEKRCREEKIRAEDPPPPMKSALMATRQLVSVLALSPQSQTLRLTPLTSALRAARAHDAVLRISISRSALALHQDSRGYFGILCALRPSSIHVHVGSSP